MSGFGGTDTHGNYTTGFKCKVCKGTLKGGAVGDAVRAATGGYRHPDPPGCKFFREQAKQRQKPPAQSLDRRRDDEKRSPVRSSPARKPVERTKRVRSIYEPVVHTPKICARDGCGREFTPQQRQSQKYCSDACRTLVAAAKKEYREKQNEKNRVERARQRAAEDERIRQQIEAGEHVHTGGTSHRGQLTCHNGTDECPIWEAQQPRVCALSSCDRVLDKPIKPGRAKKYCSRDHAAKAQGDWVLAAQVDRLILLPPDPDGHTPSGVGWASPTYPF